MSHTRPLVREAKACHWESAHVFVGLGEHRRAWWIMALGGGLLLRRVVAMFVYCLLGRVRSASGWDGEVSIHSHGREGSSLIIDRPKAVAVQHSSSAENVIYNPSQCRAKPVVVLNVKRHDYPQTMISIVSQVKRVVSRSPQCVSVVRKETGRSIAEAGKVEKVAA